MKTNLGDALRDQGMDDVLAAEHTGYRCWDAEANAVLDELINSGEPFTSEDIQERCEFEPHHVNAWGALIGTAKKQGRIRYLRHVKTRRAAAHSRLIGQWVGVSHDEDANA